MRTKEKSYRSKAIFFLNGQRQEVSGFEAGWMLADYLRYRRQLTGTKIVCAEGDCGACSVLRLFLGANQKPTHYQVINSCITTVAQLDGSSLITVDYLGKEKLDPVQECMVQNHGSQCGFCTPGFVVAIKGLMEKRGASVSLQQAKNGLTGNLCRCTGYKQILDAALAISSEKIIPLRKAPWHRGMEKEIALAAKKSLFIDSSDYTFYAPTSTKEAATYLSKHPDTKILGAGTDLGVQVNKGKLNFQRALSLHLIPDLYEMEKKGSRLYIGARVTLEELRLGIRKWIPEFADYLDIFASPQIKNVATLVGNLCNASPIGDTLPFLLVVGATVSVQGKTGLRKIPIEKYFLGYRSTALKKGELVVGVEIDIPAKGESLYLYKTSQRKDLDISAVNGAIRMGDDVKIALGGVGPIPLRLKRVEEVLQSGHLETSRVEKAIEALQDEIKPISDVRGSSAFRRLLAKNFLKSSLDQEMQRSKH